MTRSGLILAQIGTPVSSDQPMPRWCRASHRFVYGERADQRSFVKARAEQSQSSSPGADRASARRHGLTIAWPHLRSQDRQVFVLQGSGAIDLRLNFFDNDSSRPSTGFISPDLQIHFASWYARQLTVHIRADKEAASFGRCILQRGVCCRKTRRK